MIKRWWNAYLRGFDYRILWPRIKAVAPDEEAARGMMMIHASRDHAWSDLSEDEKIAIIDKLPWGLPIHV